MSYEYSFAWDFHFNSTLVRLKELRFRDCKSEILDFNSTLVRLKVVLTIKNQENLIYFNSTLVRLKVQHLNCT